MTRKFELLADYVQYNAKGIFICIEKHQMDLNVNIFFPDRPGNLLTSFSYYSSVQFAAAMIHEDFLRDN